MEQFIKILRRRQEYVWYVVFGLLIISSIIFAFWPPKQRFQTFIPGEKEQGKTNNKLVFKIFSTYSANGSLKKPIAIYADEKLLYVTDAENNTLKILNRKGSTLAVISEIKKEKINYPFGVASFSKDEVILAESGNNRLLILKKNGKFEKFLKIKGGVINKPGFISKVADQYIVSDLAGNDVKIINDKGEILKSIATPKNNVPILKYPQEVAVDSQGRYWVADGGNERIACFDKDGHYINSLNGSGKNGESFLMVKGVAILKKKYLCVSDPIANKVRIFDLSQQEKEVGELNEFIYPMGLFADKNNHLFVADRGNGVVKEYILLN